MASAPFRHSSQPDMKRSTSPLPNVYIIPPLEDVLEPWLYFDASNPLYDPSNELDDESSSNLDYIHSMLRMTYPLLDPLDSVGTPHSTKDTSRALAEPLLLESEIEDEVIMDFGMRNTCIQSREPGNDSEVIEVVKLRRGSAVSQKDDPEPPKPVKNIFSRALRSIKNVAKAPNAQSSSLKQKHGSNAGSEVSSQRSKLSRKRTVSHPQSVVSNMSSDFSPTWAGQGNGVDFDMRPTSPSPSTFTTRTTKSSFTAARRFSVLSLNKLFRIGSQSQPQSEPEERWPSQSEERMSSHDSNGPFTDSSTISSSIPGTPINASIPFLPSEPENSDHMLSKERDESLEMHLDSLHFDSLSFDASDFR